MILCTQYLIRTVACFYFINTVISSNILLILLSRTVKDCMCTNFKSHEKFKIVKKAFETECPLQSRF
jgi:hypothetical protein